MSRNCYNEKRGSFYDSSKHWLSKIDARETRVLKTKATGDIKRPEKKNHNCTYDPTSEMKTWYTMNFRISWVEEHIFFYVWIPAFDLCHPGKWNKQHTSGCSVETQIHCYLHFLYKIVHDSLGNSYKFKSNTWRFYLWTILYIASHFSESNPNKQFSSVWGHKHQCSGISLGSGIIPDSALWNHFGWNCGLLAVQKIEPQSLLGRSSPFLQYYTACPKWVWKINFWPRYKVVQLSMGRVLQIFLIWAY